LGTFVAFAQENAAPADAAADDESSPQPGADQTTTVPPAPRRGFNEREGVRWGTLMRDSAVFLGVQQGFRLATEEGTREALKGPFFSDWGNAIGAMHGWADKDPFYVNYIGHPLMGAVSNYIWINNDPEYQLVEFGTSRRYWMSRLRSAAFGFVFSTVFEIGPASEASIGNVQSKYPAQGFVDWVITPTLGFALVIGEDALDRYLVVRFEDKHKNAFMRAMVRSWAAPDRTFANILRFKQPWARENRVGVKAYPTLKERNYTDAPILSDKSDEPMEPSDHPWSLPSKFDVDFHASVGVMDAQCQGAAGTMLFNFRPDLSIVVDGGGCKLSNMPTNFSGDLLGTSGGVRYTLLNHTRFQPYAQVKTGVVKMYQREVNPAALAALAKFWGGEDKIPNNEFHLWAKEYDSTAPLISAGAGVMLGLTRAMWLRLAGADYSHVWMDPLNGHKLRDSVAITSGFELRFGNW
jgi:hypothetical protein